jgi:hypothetical protein
MFKKILLPAVAALFLTSAKAQLLIASSPDSTKSLSITGYVDAYYRFNFSNPTKTQNTFNNLTSFTNSQNSFELGMASVKLEHTSGKVGVVADLGFGKRAEEFSYNDTKTLQIVKQAYLTYAPSAHVKFTAGSFATHIGYELVDAYLNRNYSMSYMFSYGPFFHTGVKADITTKGKSAFMVGIANPSDFKSANFDRKWLIGQYSTATKDGKWKFWVNYQGGTASDKLSKLHQVDAVVTGALSDKFSIGYNGTIEFKKFRTAAGKDFGGVKQWWGSALYLNFDPSARFGLTWRNEYFGDKDGLIFNTAKGRVYESTLSANFRIGGLIIIPEIRIDDAKNNLFVKRTGSVKNATTTGLLAAVYKF